MAQKARYKQRNAALVCGSGNYFLATVHCYRLSGVIREQLVVDGVRRDYHFLGCAVHASNAVAICLSRRAQKVIPQNQKSEAQKMKSVLISTRPKWCEKICHEIGKEEAGKPIYEKRIEVRKTAPKEVPFKAYIYETKESKRRYLDDRFNSFLDNKSHYTDMGKVIGEFVCDKVYLIKNQGSRFSVADEEQSVTNEIARQSCLDYDDMVSYLGNKDGYGLHITDLKIYDKPKELSEFRKKGFMTEEEWLFNLYPNTHCHYEAWAKKFEIARPPQSWCYVEELK